jgi:NAD(P)H dehydrogenase (quinone)
LSGIVNEEKLSSESIVALVRSPQKASGLGVEVRELDFSKPDKLVTSLKGIDNLLLISSNEMGQRAKQHVNIIEAAKKAGVQWIVYTSLLRADT